MSRCRVSDSSSQAPGDAVVLGDRPQRLDVAGVDLQHLLPALERVPLALQLVPPDAAQPLVQRDLVPWRLGGPDLAVDDLGQLAPLARLFVQIGQRGQPHRVGAPQIEDLAPQLDRPGPVVERLRAEPGHARVAVGLPGRPLSDVQHLLVDAVWRMVSALVSWAIAWPGWTSHTVAAASSAAACSFLRARWPIVARDSRRSPSIVISPCS